MQRQAGDLLNHAGLEIPAVLTERLRQQINARKTRVTPEVVPVRWQTFYFLELKALDRVGSFAVRQPEQKPGQGETEKGSFRKFSKRGPSIVRRSILYYKFPVVRIGSSRQSRAAKQVGMSRRNKRRP